MIAKTPTGTHDTALPAGALLKDFIHGNQKIMTKVKV